MSSKNQKAFQSDGSVSGKTPMREKAKKTHSPMNNSKDLNQFKQKLGGINQANKSRTVSNRDIGTLK